MAVASRDAQKRQVVLRSWQKVTICHATGNGKYVRISPSVSSIVNESGHSGHPDDIIPPFTYRDGGQVKTFPGLNWDAQGQAIYDNDCRVAPPGPDPVAIGVFVKCVDVAGSTFAVTFGYQSENVAAVTLPVGAGNQVTPGGPDRGQPTVFEPGNVQSAFTVSGVAGGSSLSWSLTYAGETHVATATASFAEPCTQPPPPPSVAIFVQCVSNSATSFDATFGYDNDGQATVSVVPGQANGFDPPPLHRGQPIAFEPGTVEAAFTVEGIQNGTTLVWTLTTGGTTRTATASASFAGKCSAPPPQPPPPPPPPPPPGPETELIGVFVQCVTNRAGAYDAVFGYQNDSEDPVAIAVGENNRFQPAPAARGQPTTFLPGNVQRAFTVTGIEVGTTLSWSVRHAGATSLATAVSNFPEKCAAEPPRVGPIGIFACVVNKGSSFDAVFGYENDNPVDISVPIGLANRFDPAPLSRGQPSLFSPGKHESAFTVRGIRDTDVLAWTLTFQGARSVLVSSTYPVKCAGQESRSAVDLFPYCVRQTGQTYTAAFGYVSLNRSDVIVPIGPSNRVDPGPDDQGQPTVFRPTIVYIAFVVRRIPLGRPVSWKVASAGRVATATAAAGLERQCLTSLSRARADVTVVKSMTPGSVVVGDRVTSTIVVRNTGTAVAQDVRVSDRPLDERLELLSAASSPGRCVISERGTSQQRAVCRLGDLGPGESRRVTVSARARAPGKSRNRVTALGFPPELEADNTDTSSVTIRAAGVAGTRAPRFTG
jgi:uncharacterized repeat protein (TIGR01451 family)